MLPDGRDESDKRPAIVNPCEGVGAPEHLLLGTRPSSNEDGRGSAASRMGDNEPQLF